MKMLVQSPKKFLSAMESCYTNESKFFFKNKKIKNIYTLWKINKFIQN